MDRQDGRGGDRAPTGAVLGRTVRLVCLGRATGRGGVGRARGDAAGDPTLLVATRQGIRYAGLGLKVAAVAPGAVDHWCACADVALWAERRWGPSCVWSERELRFAELDAPRPIASAVVDEHPSGRQILHRPDLVVRYGEQVIAIEVELTPKAPRRLEQIMRAWSLALHVDQVLYLCEADPTKRAVQRAMKRRYATERVSVHGLSELERVQ